MKNYTLEDLSGLFAELQSGLRLHFDIHNLYIGGGSSRAILDHIYYDEPLFMRDFDVFAVRHASVDAFFAERVGKRLESASLGAFSGNDLRPRKRGWDYVAGWGFFFKHPGVVIDLSIFHSFFDLGLNGLLDIDTVMIPSQESMTLLEVCDHIRSNSYAEACSNAFIYDRFQGYPKYRTGTGNIIQWDAVAPDPVQIAIRVVRTFAKMDCEELPAPIQAGLGDAVRNQRGFDRFQALRNLLKLLDDKNAAQELKILQRLGIFEFWLTGLAELTSTEQRNAVLNELSLASASMSANAV